MLEQHFDTIEGELLAKAKRSASSGHPVNRGSPREVFIKEFLESHLNSTVAIGSGEIIDAKSRPRETRNQYDIVIYKRNFPKLDFGGDVSGFLVESVIATIEVKSLLNKAAIEQAVKAAHTAKRLKKSVDRAPSFGWIPPSVLNYVVAYDGPSQMATVANWIAEAHKKFSIPLPDFSKSEQVKTAGTAIDGVFVLQKGFSG